MLIKPPIKFEINDVTQVVGDGKYIIVKSIQRLQTASADADNAAAQADLDAGHAALLDATEAMIRAIERIARHSHRRKERRAA